MANADNSLYVQKNEHGIVIIFIYVDDLIVGGDNEDEIAHVKTLMKQEFDMKDLGELRYFLGIEIDKRRHMAVTKTICIGYVIQIWYG